MSNITNSEGHELSPQQKNIWNSIETGLPFGIQGAVKVNNVFDIVKLQDGVNEIIKKHEILRSKFVKQEGLIYPLQFVDEHREIEEIKVIDGKQSEDKQAIIDEFFNQIPSNQIQVNDYPFFGVRALKFKEKEWYLKIFGSSMILDKRSVDNLIKEVLVFFTCEKPIKKEEEIQYKEFAKWQNKLLNSPDIEVLEFLDRYNYRDYLINRNLVFESIKNQGFNIRETVYADKTLENSFTQSVLDLGEKLGVDYTTILTSTLHALLKMHDPLFNEVIGLNTNRREFEQLENSIGPISKYLPLHFKIEDGDTLEDVLKRNQDLIDEVEECGDYLNPFSEIIENKQIVFAPILVECFEVDNVKSLFLTDNCIGFKLKVEIVVDNEVCKLIFKGSSNYFENSVVQLILDQFLLLLSQFVENHHFALEEYTLVSRENQAFISSLNNTHKVLNPSNVIEIFENAAIDNPSYPAIVFRDTETSYKKLAKNVNRFASTLINDFGVKKGDVVAVSGNRSDELITCFLGIQKAAAIYLPIDKTSPTDRVSYMLENSRATLLISDEKNTQKEAKVKVVGLTEIMSAQNGNVIENYPKLDQDDLAYIIFTSGSTGLPKGCSISHGSLSNYIQWSCNQYKGEGTKGGIPLFSSVAFDMTITSIFNPLVQGNCLYIYEEDEELTEILNHAFTANDYINKVKLTPSHLKILSGGKKIESKIEIVILGGEAVSLEDIELCRKLNPKIKIYNEYGPTECTVGCICKEVGDETKVLVGQPIANTQVIITKSNGRLCGLGELGEIVVAGAGLSKGYLNNPEANKESFIFSDLVEGKRMYKTGDQGRWMANGNIEYVGRNDGQIKLSGYRIELGEIEHVIKNYPSVDDAAVVAQTNKNGDQSLVAYLIGKEKGLIDNLKVFLNNQLPTYMVPHHFVQRENLPLNQNGKIDRRRLTEEEIATRAKYMGPRNEIDEQLIELWEELLGIEKIGILDDFFDLGGHSINAMLTITKIENIFNLRFKIKDVFSNPTIKSLGDIILAKTLVNQREKIGSEEGVEIEI